MLLVASVDPPSCHVSQLLSIHLIDKMWPLPACRPLEGGKKGNNTLSFALLFAGLWWLESLSYILLWRERCSWLPCRKWSIQVHGIDIWTMPRLFWLFLVYILAWIAVLINPISVWVSFGLSECEVVTWVVEARTTEMPKSLQLMDEQGRPMILINWLMIRLSYLILWDQFTTILTGSY